MSTGQAAPRSAGQAVRRQLPWLRRALAVLVALPLLLGLAVAILAWRLAQGPIEIPPLAREIEARLNLPEAAGRINIARAAIAWEGMHANGSPLDLRLTGIRLQDRQGQILAALPDAAVTFGLGTLLRGRLAPATIILLDPDFTLRRDANGTLRVELGGLDATSPAEASNARPPTPAPPGILAELLRPEADGIGPLGALTRLRVSGGTLRVSDAALGRDWRLAGLSLDLRRQAGPNWLSGEGDARLEIAELAIPVRVSGEVGARGLSARMDLPLLQPAELAAALPDAGPLGWLDAALAIQLALTLDAAFVPQNVTLAVQAPQGGLLRPDSGAGIRFEGLEARALFRDDLVRVETLRLALAGSVITAQGMMQRTSGGWDATAGVTLDGLDFAALPAHWPEGLAPQTRTAVLAAVQAGRLGASRLELIGTATAGLTKWQLAQARLALGLRAAKLDPGLGQPLLIESLEGVLVGTPQAVRLDSFRVTMGAAQPRSPTPTLGISGEARLAQGGWRGMADVTLDRVRLADLGQFWPPAIAPNARDWLVANLSAGEASNGVWQLQAEAGPSFENPQLVATGGLTVEGATVHWLRPVPPLRGLSGRIAFARDLVTVTARGARQDREGEQAGTLEARDITLRILLPPGQPERLELSGAIAGPLIETVAVLRHPRLRLFERRPFPLNVTAGTQETSLSIAFPLLASLQVEQIRLRAETRVRNARLARLLFERDLEELSAEIVSETEKLSATGTASFMGSPMRLNVEMDFRPGPPAQVVARETASLRLDAARLAEIGFDAGALLAGPVAIEARTERRRNNATSVQLRGDLRDAVLAFPPLNWEKSRGTPGSAEALLRLQGDQLTSIENFRVEALEVSLRGRATARAGRIERVELQDSLFGGSRFTGDARAPATAGGPWAVNLRGPVLDLRPLFGPAGHVSGGAARDRLGEREAMEGSSPPLLLDLRFDQVLLGEGRDVFAVLARARTDGRGVVREASLRGRTARLANAFDVALTPRGETRQLRASAEDAGALLRALGIIETMQGGRLSVAAQYAENRPGAPLTGTAEIDQFSVRNAVALGKLLQAMTLYGMVDAMQGGGSLSFNRAVIPFTLSAEEVRIQEARAFSPSLGITARGRVLRQGGVLDMEGTIVPAYFFNSLLGNLPLVGRLFSPEAGGGVFAATFRAQGPAEDAQITVNPLAALTPGFLRGLFGLGQEPRAAEPRPEPRAAEPRR